MFGARFFIVVAVSAALCFSLIALGTDTWPLLTIPIVLISAHFLIDFVTYDESSFKNVCVWLSILSASLCIPLMNLSAVLNGETWAIIPTIKTRFEETFAPPKPSWLTVGDEIFSAEPHWFATPVFLISIILIPLLIAYANTWIRRRLY